MRGRTNVGGGGIALNANVVNKTIKSGNIIAGDFVQYYTEDSSIEQSLINLFVGKIGNYCVTLASDYESRASIRSSSTGAIIRIFKDGEQISSYNGYPINDAYVCDNYIVFVSSNSKIIGVLTIQNDTLVEVNTLSVTNYYSYICMGNNKVIAWRPTGSTHYFAVCNISTQGILSQKNEQNMSVSYCGEYLNAIIYGTNFYITGYNSSSSTTTRVNKLTIDSNNNITATYMNFSVPSAIVEQIIFKNGDHIVCGVQPVSINLATGAYQQLSIGGSRRVSNIENGYFVAAENGENSLYLYNYNELTDEITLLDTYNASTFQFYVLASLLFIDGDYVYARQYSGDNDLYLFNIIGNSYIERKADEDYVVPFSEYGHPIGIAKDSGTANEIIGVYVPISS